MNKTIPYVLSGFLVPLCLCGKLNAHKSPVCTESVRKLATIAVLLIATSYNFAQQGKAIESLSFVSAILKDTVNCSVALPFNYETSGRSYPVVYLLHGYTNDETTWLRTGGLQDILARGIQNGDMTEMILVMPDGADTRYCNDYRHKRPWRDMFIKEFIPWIERKYRIISAWESRAIAGQSMGGYGALMLAMNHPHVFSTCVALGAALCADEDLAARPKEKYDRYWGAIYGEDLEGEARITETWKSHNPLDLVQTIPEEKLRAVRFYMDCGDDDLRTKGNSILHLRMLEAGIPHEYRVRQGGHDWQYWRTGIYEGLKFISENLNADPNER